MYKCPECNTPLNESMFCVKCCSKWTKFDHKEIKEEPLIVNAHTKNGNTIVDIFENITEDAKIMKDFVDYVESWAKRNVVEKTIIKESENEYVNAKNNGGDTYYYLIPDNAKYCQDIIESREMNFSQGNILKAAFCFNMQRGDSDYERDLNKIIWFANRELDRIR